MFQSVFEVSVICMYRLTTVFAWCRFL